MRGNRPSSWFVPGPGRPSSRRALAAVLIAALAIGAAAVAPAAARLVVGTDGHDRIRGGDRDDVIDVDSGEASFDRRTGLGTVLPSGRDRVRAGGGDDVAELGERGDLFKGGSGDDVARLDGGADHFRGGSGDDAGFGGDGDDLLVGGEGDDLLVGEAGADDAKGGDGRDAIGSELGDSSRGGDGDDVLTHCWGDELCGGRPERVARLDAGAGDDLLQVRPLGAIAAEGGDGDDYFQLDLEDFPRDLDDLAQGVEIDGGDGEDTLQLPAWARSKDLPERLRRSIERVSFDDDLGEIPPGGSADAGALARIAQADSDTPSGAWTVGSPSGSFGGVVQSYWERYLPTKIVFQPAPPLGSRPQVRARLLAGDRLLTSVLLTKGDGDRWAVVPTDLARICGKDAAPDGVLTRVTLEPNRNSILLTCRVAKLGDLDVRLPTGADSVALRNLAGAIRIYEGVKGKGADVGANDLTIEPSYPTSFPLLGDGSSYFSALRPVWTLGDLERLVASSGEEEAKEIVTKSGWSVIPTPELALPSNRHSSPFYLELKRPKSVFGTSARGPRGETNGLYDALARKQSVNWGDGQIRKALEHASAIEVQRDSPYAASLFYAIERGEKMKEDTFVYPYRRAGGTPKIVQTKLCSGQAPSCMTVETTEASFLLFTKLALWTGERGGKPNPDKPFVRLGRQTSTNMESPKDSRMVTGAPLPPLERWRQPIWNLDALKVFHDAARDPEGTCARMYRTDNAAKASCVKNLGQKGSSPINAGSPDFFWEFLEGLWVTGMKSSEITLLEGGRTETIYSEARTPEKSETIPAGTGRITTSSDELRYFSLNNLPMLQFDPFRPLNNKNPNSLYGQSGWPYQTYCDGKDCNDRQFKEFKQSDLERGYNSAKLTIRRAGDDPIRWGVVRLPYTAQRQGPNPNPCNRGPTGLDPDPKDVKGRTDAVPRWMEYVAFRGPGVRYAWQASRRTDDVKAEFVDEWGKDYVDRVEKGATPSKLEFRQIRTSGERATVCVNFAFDSTTVGRQEFKFGRRWDKDAGQGTYQDRLDRKIRAPRLGADSDINKERWGTFVGRWVGRLECPADYPINLSAYEDKFGDDKETVADNFEQVSGVHEKEEPLAVKIPETAAQVLGKAGEVKELLETFGSHRFARALGFINAAGISIGLVADGIKLGIVIYDWYKGPPAGKTAAYHIAHKDVDSVNARAKNDDSVRATDGWMKDEPERQLEHTRGTHLGRFAVLGDAMSDSGRFGDTSEDLKRSIGATPRNRGYQDVALYSQNKGEVSAWIQCSNTDLGPIHDRIQGKPDKKE